MNTAEVRQDCWVTASDLSLKVLPETNDKLITGQILSVFVKSRHNWADKLDRATPSDIGRKLKIKVLENIQEKSVFWKVQATDSYSRSRIGYLSKYGLSILWILSFDLDI